MAHDVPGNSDAQASRASAEILAARRQVEEANVRGRNLAGAALPPKAGRGPTASPTATVTIPGFTSISEVHRGGQGVVYEARQESTRRRVALKILHHRAPKDDVAKLRFARETHVLGRLNHPNIVTIHDSGTADDHAYFVMDYVEGVPLDRYVAQAKPGVAELLRLFITICDAVHEAHLRGIIHRDLKPGNILVDERGTPHVLDFGLAKVAEEDEPDQAVTVTGQFIGSLPWSAPEQVEGQSAGVDTRTDVYSLGVMLYQVLSGRFPYNVTGSARDVMNRILHSDPGRLAALSRSTDEELDTMVLKCLHKEPDRRYDNAGHLARDLRSYLAGEPIEAKRDSGWYVFRKAIRRHRVPVAFAGLVVVFGIVVFVGLIVSHNRQRRLRAEAQRQAAIAEAVNRFLNQDLLAAVKPQEMGREVTVREVLDAASLRIEQQFPDQPVIEAAIHETIGSTYMELGEWHAALDHAERALGLRREHLGELDPATLSAMQLVGRLYRRLGRYGEAQAMLQMMVQGARETLGPEHPLTTQGMNNLAYALAELGRYKEALAVNQRVLEIRTRILGPEHPDTLKSLNNQGYYLEKFGRYEDAERMYAKAFELREKVLGTDHPDTLASMGTLANTWTTLGRLEEAVRLHRDGLERITRVMGERHPMALRRMGMLGDVYCRLGQLDKAEPLLVHAYKTWCELVGDHHRDVAESLWRLGLLYVSQRRFDEAEKSLVQARQTFHDTLGPDHIQSKFITFELGEFYFDRGRYDLAEPLLIVAARSLDEAFGKGHPTPRAAQEILIRLYESWHVRAPDQGYDRKAARLREQFGVEAQAASTVADQITEEQP